MTQAIFQQPTWYRAVTLMERVMSLRANDTSPESEMDTDLAQRRINRWRSHLPTGIDANFPQYLASAQITEDELLHIVGEPIEAVKRRFPTEPVWLKELAQSYSYQSTYPCLEQEEVRNLSMAGFLGMVEPLIICGRDRLREGIRKLAETQQDLPFDTNAIEKLFLSNLRQYLLAIIGRTITLELNVARVEGRLEGATPEERFYNFVESLGRHDDALAIMQEYPVLGRMLVRRIEQWVAFGLEFLSHLCTDWRVIANTFGTDSGLGDLVKVDGTAGDLHRDGRSVLIATFSSGAQVVYKPRSLSVDVHFQEFLKWINDRGDHAPFRTLTILDRGSYGWVEFVSAESCRSTEEVQRFYERIGCYLAVLYVLEGTDIHFENLIASGEHPLIIDLEAIFHPRIVNINVEQADRPDSALMINSVLRIGLLPQRIWTQGESAGVDVSGLGGSPGQVLPYGIPQWDGEGTDQMRLTYKQSALKGAGNRPTLSGKELNVLDYTPDVATGFTAVYQLLLKHREDLLSDDGPISRFGGDEVRVLLRPTQAYGTLLQDSTHPDVLRDALDRDRLFNRLWMGVEACPNLVKAIPAEQEDLLNGVIPLFTTRPNSCEVWTSSNERITGLIFESGLNLVRNRLRQLSEKDLAQQLWFIRASVATTSASIEQPIRSNYSHVEPNGSPDCAQLLQAARAVGGRLESLTLKRGEDNATWLGLSQSDERHPVLAPLGIELYDGLSGIAFFLGYLGAVTGEERFSKLADATLSTVRNHVERSPLSSLSMGAFSGLSGVIYTLTHLGVLWNRPALLHEAESLANRITTLIECDEDFDVVGGAAGCILTLISLYRCIRSDRVRAAAIQCGNRLLACGKSMNHGIGWVQEKSGTKPLAGFAHGAAGIAWSLLELASFTSEENYRTLALDAIAYERSLFSSDAGNWPDLREQVDFSDGTNRGRPAFIIAWCHGASGIGLARLQSLKHLDGDEVKEEIAVALKTTLDYGFGRTHTLCHGDLGNLELVFNASETFDDLQLRHQARRLIALVLDSIDSNGWLCANPLSVESPGLMTGLAGIGYQLLRFAEPKRVPSVLLLDPPPHTLSTSRIVR